MPLFEYACTACNQEFETLVRGDQAPRCPACQGTVLTRRQSVFAARTTQGSSVTQVPVGGGCGACGDPRGPGACSMN